MRKDSKCHSKPRIVLTICDSERLSDLAAAAMSRLPEIAAQLTSEIERAEVSTARSVLPNVAQMGSTVAFKLDDGQHKRVTLVFPSEADISRDRISILTPIGIALIGLSEGQSITWVTRDGRERRLTVVAVEQVPDSSPNRVRSRNDQRLKSDRRRNHD
jgi:regulator of nucleoside diphosphate kinase